MEKSNQKDLRRGGFYWIDKHPYVSVTTALSILDKPALRYWLGQQVYRAFMVDPTLSEQDALAAPYAVSDKAKKRGSTIHSIIESFKNTGEIVDTTPEFQNYVDAFKKFVKDNDVEIVEQEKTAVSIKYKFAGTCDLVFKAKGRDGVWVGDIKTGKALYPEVFIQTSAYKQALNETGSDIKYIAGILLKENGNYEFQEGEDCFDIFLHTMEIWKWKNKDLMEITKFYKGESQKG